MDPHLCPPLHKGEEGRDGISMDPLPTRQHIDDPVISVRSVIKRYGKITAVDGVSFHVRRGETYGLLGPNGAGKTSTMRMLSAVSPLSGGEMTVAGLDVARQGREVRQVLGVVTQKDGLDSDLTVRQNLEIYGYLSGLSSGASRARAAEVLEFFGLSDRAGGDVDELSGVTVLMSTHYMEEAATLCDRVAIMDHGRILDEGAPDELVARRAGSEVAQVRASAATRQAVLASLRGAGYQCVEVGALINVTSQNGERPDLGPAALNGARVSYRSANLEDVFLALTGRELRDE